MPSPVVLVANRLQHYRASALRDDVVAALIVAVLLLPQSLAYALLAGLPPQVGLYASVLPMLAYAALGSSRVNSVGPAAVLALMTAQAIGTVAGLDGISASLAATVLAIEVGVLLGAAALLKLDALASLLSAPVLNGFSTGAALSIALSQLPALLGSPAHGVDTREVLRSWWASGTWGQVATASFGLVALCLLGVGKHSVRRVAQRWWSAEHAGLAARCAPLVVIALATAVAWAVSAPALDVAVVGPLPAFRLPLAWPRVDAALWWLLLPSASLIALVSFVSSLAVAESLALQRGEHVDSRRELAGLGAANLAAGLSGGMPVGGSFSRSAVNADAGARTRASGMWAALFMVIAVVLFSAPLALLPRAVLAASIIVAVLGVVEWKAFAQAWRYSRGEAAVMVTVAALTFWESTQWALAMGVGVSIALLLKHTARPHTALIGRMPGTEHYRNVDRYPAHLIPGLLGLRIDESLLFTNARQLPSVVASYLAAYPDTRRVLLQMSPVNRIDLSGLEALRALHDGLAERGIRLDLSEVKGPVLDGLRTGAWSSWFRGRLFLSHHHGVNDEDGMHL